MPQVDLANFTLQIKLLILYICLFYFFLDKYFIFFIFNTKKIKLILKYYNIFLKNNLFNYKKKINNNQLYIFYNIINYFLKNIIVIINFLILEYKSFLKNNLIIKNNFINIFELFINYNFQNNIIYLNINEIHFFINENEVYAEEIK